MKFCHKIHWLLGTVILCLSFPKIAIGTEAFNEDSSTLKPYENYNVIMIFIDTLRADHLNCYGYPRKTSPHIDKIAQESFVFENNFTPASYTLASFMSIITSLYPKSHGVLHIMKDKLSTKIKTLAEILQAYEYETAWFGPLEDPHLDLNIGFGRGFEHIGVFHNGDLIRAKNDILHWIETNKDEKFFLNFHTYGIHIPYWSSLKYQEKFVKQEKEEIIKNEEELVKATFETVRDGLFQRKGDVWQVLGEDLARGLISEGLVQGDFSHKKVTAIKEFLKDKKQQNKWDCFLNYTYISRINFKDSNTKKYIEALYDAQILEFDSEIIGPLTKRLKDLKLYDKTIIVICSDHGEEFGEHGGANHGGTLYDEVVHVPLIIKVPWLKQGGRIQELAQTVDILPTLLDLLGIPIPYHAQGKSFSDIINEDYNSAVRDYVFGHHIYISYIRSKEWKLILYQKGGKESKEPFYLQGDREMKELFYLPLDPGESQNLYFRKRDTALKLESELRQWEDSLISYQEQEYPFLPGIDAKTQERIKRTGYW